MTQIREGGVEIPAGMKLVPIEPTHDMQRAFVDLALRGDVLSHGGWMGYARDQWSAMLAAYTPTPSPEIAEQPMGEAAAAARNVYLLQGDNGRMADALRQCRDQFAFYAREHEAAGKTEKAATNARFAKIADRALTAKETIDPFTTARNFGEGLPGHGMSADVQVAEQPMDLWRDEIGKLVEAGFATVSRNPSDHEVVLAYRAAIHLALATPKPADPTPDQEHQS